MTNDVYSRLLIYALAYLGIAVALLLLAAWRKRRHRMVSSDLPRQAPYRHLLWLSRLSSFLAEVTAMLALTTHFIIAHRTANNLPVPEFVLLHPAPFVIIVLSLLAYWLARRPDAA